MDFAWLLQAVMHERSFKDTTSYTFPCMVFALCRLAGVPVWHIDVLKTPSSTVDIGLIRDEANELAPRRGPHSEVLLLGDNLEAMVEQAQTANPATSEPTDTTPVDSISGGSTTPSSSCSTTFATLVPIARVQKLDAKWPHFFTTSSLGCRGLLLRQRSA